MLRQQPTKLIGTNLPINLDDGVRIGWLATRVSRIRVR